MRDAAACAAAVGVLLDAADSGPDTTSDAVWEAIDAVVPRSDLRAAVDNLTATLPPPDADPAGEWRAELIERYAEVRSFVPQLCRTIEFGATTEGGTSSSSGAHRPRRPSAGLPGMPLPVVGVEVVARSRALRRRGTAGRQMAVHVGRVNSWRRLDLVASWNVDSVDGTYLAFGPDTNGRRLAGWLRRLDTQPVLSRRS